MFGWLKSLFGNTAAPPDADDTAETPPADVIQLAAERDYRAPDQAPYTDPSDTKTYRQAHRAGWEFFAQGSYSYLGPDGRPNGEVLGRGSASATMIPQQSAPGSPPASSKR